MSVTFSTALRSAETKNATGITVPPELVAELGGGKAPLVKVTVNGYSYRGKVAVYGGECLVGFSAEHRAASGIAGGDPITVTLELDLEPRLVELPDDFRAALEAAQALTAFEELAPSHKKEHVRAISEAKTEETRARRIAAAVDKLANS